MFRQHLKLKAEAFKEKSVDQMLQFRTGINILGTSSVTIHWE
jgi:hypothetical protein